MSDADSWDSDHCPHCGCLGHYMKGCPDWLKAENAKLQKALIAMKQELENRREETKRLHREFEAEASYYEKFAQQMRKTAKYAGGWEKNRDYALAEENEVHASRLRRILNGK